MIYNCISKMCHACSAENIHRWALYG